MKNEELPLLADDVIQTPIVEIAIDDIEVIPVELLAIIETIKIIA
jgi:hypothetical protein